MTSAENFKKILSVLNVTLPSGRNPFLVRVIALITVIGGLSVMGNVFADIVTPAHESVAVDIVRLIAGIAILAAGYGILRHKSWTVWVYGFVTIVGFIENPVLAVVPLAITVYLYTLKIYFDPTVPKKAFLRMRRIVAENYGVVWPEQEQQANKEQGL